MRIAVFDYSTTQANPVGSCNLQIIHSLADEHQFAIFTTAVDESLDDRAVVLKVPSIRRPLAALFVTFHVMAPLRFLTYRLRNGRPDIIQVVESNLLLGNICYAHFCHRAFLGLSRQHERGRNVRQLLRRLDHRLHAALEPFVFRRIDRIVAVSRGLKREIEREYPFTRGKITVIPNPVDAEAFACPDDFDRSAVRQSAGISHDELTLVFVALGHFERKGLPEVLQALKKARAASLKLVVVGGSDDLVAEYRRVAQELDLTETVRFAGMQNDVRPWLWVADGFILPSLYEAFPLVVLQAAAAGLPLVVTPVNGVEEFVRDGKNAILVEHDSDSVYEGLTRFLELGPADREAMGRTAQADVARYSTASFSQAWAEVYEQSNVS